MNRLLYILLSFGAVLIGSLVLAVNPSHGFSVFNSDNGDLSNHSIFFDNSSYMVGYYGPSRKDLNHNLGGILPHTFSNAPFYRSSVFHLDDKNVMNYLDAGDTLNAFLPGPSRTGLNHKLEDKNVSVQKDSLTVSPDGDISTLQQAILQADSGTVITMEAGTYKEHNVIIDKSVTIDASGEVIIDGEEQGFVLQVTSNHVTIRNIEVHNSKMSFTEDYAGILLENVRHVTIENITLIDNFFGIYLAKSSDVTVRNNRVLSTSTRETTSGNGIHLWYCKNITIEGNTVKGHRDGIYFEFVEDSQIHNNISKNNLRYGLHFMFSDSCAYTGNTFAHNSAGVAVMFTEKVVMRNNTFRDNWGAASYGLLLKEITDSKIINNDFTNNTTAMHIEASNRIVIKHNNIQDNGVGIRIMANSVDNSIMENNFLQNTFDVTTNSRQNYSNFSRNYWSDYEGYDLNRDGVGDVPHRPVSLFAILVERYPQALVLLRSLVTDLLNTAERVMPVLTPESLVDEKPLMEKIQ